MNTMAPTIGSTARSAAAAASDQFLGVDWGGFAIVFVASFAAAVIIVVFYSLGLRLLAVGSSDDTGADGEVVSTARGARPLGATVVGYLCIGIGVVAVLYSLYLIIPQFH